MQFNFKPDMSAVKELKQKLANKSLEPGFDWFEKMSKQTLNFMKTHPKLYPAYVNSKSYRNLFQTSATGETTASTGQNDSISTPGSPVRQVIVSNFWNGFECFALNDEQFR